MKPADFLVFIFMILIGSAASGQESDKMLGFGLGISSGTMTTDTSTNSTNLESLSYSALAYSTFVSMDVSPTLTAEVGGEMLVLLASAQSNQSISKGGYGSLKYHLVGSSHEVSEGTRNLYITRSSPLRVSMPFIVKYDNIDFTIKDGVLKKSFSGAVVVICSGFQVEKDFSRFGLGFGIVKSISTMQSSAKYINIDYVTAALSLKVAL